MLIVKLEAGENGARKNQVIIPALEHVPEGWAAVPPELEAEALELLPWLDLEVRDGAVAGIGDAARADDAAQGKSPAGAGSAQAGPV